MKKGLKILLYALLLALILSACASKSENHAAASDTTASTTDETSVAISTKTEEETTRKEDTKPEDAESQKEDMPETATQNEISQPEEPQDTAVKELSQESYDTFYAAMGNEDDSMDWQKTTPSELRTASVKRAFRILTDSYLGNRYRFYYLLQ